MLLLCVNVLLLTFECLSSWLENKNLVCRMRKLYMPISSPYFKLYKGHWAKPGFDSINLEEMGKYRALKFHAYKLVRPVPSTSRGKCNADQNLEDAADITDGGPTPDIFPHSHSYHVPLFILTISLVEIIIFVYHTISLSHNHKITSSGPIPYCSVLMYNPFRRYEVMIRQ